MSEVAAWASDGGERVALLDTGTIRISGHEGRLINFRRWDTPAVGDELAARIRETIVFVHRRGEHFNINFYRVTQEDRLKLTLRRGYDATENTVDFLLEVNGRPAGLICDLQPTEAGELMAAFDAAMSPVFTVEVLEAQSG